jgi:hypothetical protein
MPSEKTLYVSEATHRRLKILAAKRNRSMGDLVAEMVERETEDLDNAWLSPGGLELQSQMLRDAWDDPALDVYNRD